MEMFPKLVHEMRTHAASPRMWSCSGLQSWPIIILCGSFIYQVTLRIFLAWPLVNLMNCELATRPFFEWRTYTPPPLFLWRFLIRVGTFSTLFHIYNFLASIVIAIDRPCLEDINRPKMRKSFVTPLLLIPLLDWSSILPLHLPFDLSDIRGRLLFFHWLQCPPLDHTYKRRA